MIGRTGTSIVLSLFLGSFAPASAGSAAQEADPTPLRVCATTPDLGSLTREIGGEHVEVTVFVRGPEDPHYLSPRPSFVKALSRADLLVVVGLELEIGWAPRLWQNARNRRVLPGGAGFVDASVAVEKRGIPQAPVDRSMGDVHHLGNPHYLLDPMNGLRVAALLRDRLQAARPALKEVLDRRYRDFERRVSAALVGEELAAKYSVDKLCRLQEAGKLLDVLEAQGDAGRLGGWLGAVAPVRGTRVVADHDLWPYFAARFGVEVIGFLEPSPGIPPTTRHLRELIDSMQAENVRGILAVPYYNARYARFVSEKSGAPVISLAHQVGAMEGATDYLSTVDVNVRSLVKALRKGSE